MNSTHPLISRTSICILSFILVQSGLMQRVNPHLALHCVLVGTAGLIGYVGLKWSSMVRRRALVERILIELGHVPR